MLVRLQKRHGGAVISKSRRMDSLKFGRFSLKLLCAWHPGLTAFGEPGAWAAVTAANLWNRDI